MLIIISLLTLIAFADSFLALTLLVKDTKNVAKRFFGASILFLVVWTISTVLLLQSSNQEVIAVTPYFFLISPLLLSYFLDIFLKLSINNRLGKYTYASSASLVIAIMYSLLFAPDIISNVNTVGAINNVIVGTVPFLIYSALLSTIFSQIMTSFFSIRKKKKSERAQWNTVLLGIALTIQISTITNIVLPLVGIGGLIWLGPLSTAVTLATITFSITKYSLFDVRVVAARAVAYAVSIAVIIGIFVAATAAVSSLSLFDDTGENVERLAFISLSIVSAIVYQPVKVFFDKLTNTIFYRDAYDSQVLMDTFNQTLVATVDLELLLQRTATLIQDNLKASSVVFYLRKTSYSVERIIDKNGQKVEIKNLESIAEESVEVKGKVFSAEYEESKASAPKLQKLLKKNDTAVLARLVSAEEYKIQGVGLLFIGSRQSGSLYSEQDLRLLNIIVNELIIAIENIQRYEEIEQFNVTLQKKTDAATRELKRSNEKLLALDQAKDEFVSMASHQLRTPLTSIKGFVAMVLDGDAGKLNDTQQQMLQQTFISSQRMVYLISDLLNVSRLKTGKFHIDAKLMKLSDLVESELSQLHDEILVKNLKFNIKLPKNEVAIKVDEMKTRQVVMNFVDNAIYYTPKGGSIDVEVKQDKKTTTFTVQDSGIGVPDEQQQKLFTKFFRADNARKVRPDGTGLGLFMAKKVIEAQGGKVLFSSKLNSGSLFGFSYNNKQLDTKE